MSTTKFFPPITAILPVEALPNELGFVKTGLTSMLSHVYFRDLQCSQNDRGDSGFYSLKIVSLKRLDIEIPGTGIFLILNPSHDPNTPAITEFPISLSYRWPILGYLRQFNLETFSFKPGDIFDLALRVVGVTPRQVVERALNLFVPSASPIDTFVDNVNALFGTSIAHPASTSTDPLGDVLQEIDNAANINGAGGAVFALYLLDALSEDSTRDRISTFFEEFFDGGRIEEFVKQLLTPKIDATLALGLAIEFPRNVLEPLDAVGGEPLADQTIKTWLTFEAGSFFYSTDRGIGFDQMLEAALNHPCRIAGTSFGISLDRAKLDISRTTNIPEATADGRPVDFVGVYINDATLSFPAIWNHDEPNSTGVIRGRDLLIGTGGFSGTLALEAVSAGHSSPVVKVKFGKDFSISLDKFSITLKQNAIKGSKIEGTLVIPGFKDANDKPAEIRIKVDIHQDGDFDVTAREDDGFKTIKCGQIFDVTLKSVFFGKRDDDFYIGVSGTIKFTHQLLSSLAPIEVEKLLIWSDGRFEIEGGTIPLPKNIRFPIGPAELSISAIHLGSHQQEKSGLMRQYRYFGFDGGVDMNPGVADVRGKGIKFYFTVDSGPFDSYFEIKSIAIDLVIPGSASKDTATLLISGYLSVGGTATDPEYEGGIKFFAPKAKIGGGASMKLRPKKPAFVIDAFVELSTPIPLGATGLGFYGFRAVFGLRYLATKQAAQLQDTDTWFDYYKVKDPNTQLEGISISKLETPLDTPDNTKNYDNAFSIGAGVSLATAQDSGKTFSCKLFLLLSLPDLIYLEGKANILGERVGLTGEDPPFFAMLAISSKSVEMGAGVSYKLPRDGAKKGWILDLNAEMRAAFFFQNSSAWYINFGTIENPTTARVLSLFDATSYVMLSAAGIRAGAGVTFEFDKSYAGGMVRASVGVYIKVGGFISFERPQIGGFAMLGGHVDVSLMWFSFYLVIDTSLSVEAPKPFYIQGSVHLCVGVTIGFWKFKKHIEKCFDVEFKWEKNPTVDIDAVLPFADPNVLLPIMGTNMLSAESFNIAYLGDTIPSAAPSFDQAVLPLDTWVDLEFLKGLFPAPAVDERIGRLSGQPPTNAIDYIPPAEAAHKVKHEYSIKAVEIRAWNGSTWVDYRPYQAMSPPDALAALNANPSAYKDGFWQNSGSGFNKLRLLAETSLSYMQQGQPGWYIPEQFGITSATLSCRTKLREKLCLRWVGISPGTEYPDDAWRQFNTVLYRVSGGPGNVIDWNSSFGIPRSLLFPNEATAQVVFNKPCVEVDLKLTTFSSGVVLRFYKRETVDSGFVYTLVETRQLNQLQLLAPVHYNDPAAPVAKVEIDPINADPAAISALQIQIDALYRQLYEGKLEAEAKNALIARIRKLERELVRINSQGCRPKGIDKKTLIRQLTALERDVLKCRKLLASLMAEQKELCQEAADLRDQFVRCFPSVPSTLSYEVLLREERDPATRYQWQFRVYDDLTDAVLLNSTPLYRDAATAERALFETLKLATYLGDYALMLRKDGRYFFQLVATSGRFIAVSPAHFTKWAQLFAFVKQTQAKFRAALAGGNFNLARRVAGRLPCDESLSHLICWNELPFLGAAGKKKCKKVVDGMLSARDAFCRQYNKLYRELYACNNRLLDDLTARCEEMTRYVETKSAACQALNEQLEAVQELISLIDHGGALLPPEGSPCTTLLHEVCCLSLEDHQFNLSVPEHAAIQQDYANAIQGIEKRLTPIWRPDTKYSIRVQLTDTVTSPNNNVTSHDNDFYFGFRTAGPVGHFHTDLSANYIAPGKTSDHYMLTGLKGYIDYGRSYPNADGQLIGAKPLFYEDARILLFFTKRYVYHFFGDWPAYNGLPALTGNAMQIIIKDPAENISIPNPSPPEMITTEIPQAVASWPKDDDPRIPEDIRTLLNLRNPELLNPDFLGGDCWSSGGEMITPASVYIEIIPNYLKPLKLYTAVMNNVHGGQIKEVHQYPFQTSRYPDFEAQVKSYRLDDGKGNQREAIFRIDVPLSVADINLMYDVVTGNMLSASNAALAATWADPFDRLVEAVMKLKPLDAAITTEFNFVRNSTTDAVVAVWLRNPEPFNDPKLPDDVLKRSLRVMNGLNPDLGYEILFSKDRSQAFVMHSSKVIPVTQMKFRFTYIEWDGSDYVDHNVVTGFIPTTI